MQAWTREAAAGLEIYGVYWLLLGDAALPPSRWGPHIDVRPVPPEYDYGR